jgi:hypothetical protein
MEGAESCEVHASLAKVHEFANHILDACQVDDSFYYVVGNLCHRSKSEE